MRFDGVRPLNNPSVALRLVEALEAFQRPRNPLRLQMTPPDLWTGSAETGRALINALREYPGGYESAITAFWQTADETGADHRHGFNWLRDLRACGGDQARRAARHLIDCWVDRYGRIAGEHRLLDPALLGARLAAWVQHYDFYGASADNTWQEVWLAATFRQGRLLTRAIPGNMNGTQSLQAIAGLILTSVAIAEQDEWLARGLTLLQTELAAQLLGDGGHISRSPAQLLLAYMRCQEIRSALVTAGVPVPATLQHSIDRMGPALRFFRYADQKLACFNGTQEEDAERLNHWLSAIDVKGKGLRSLPVSGYERLSCGRALLMFDHGLCPAAPYDRWLHAAPLAFEFSYGRERIFVNCGTHPTDPAWQDALRATAAHSTLTIDDRNAIEIRQDGHIGRVVRKALVKREDTEESSLIEASHDGYMPAMGIVHHRRLFLSQKGQDLRGEETLTCNTGLAKPHQITLRFHLHPRVLVSPIRDGAEFLLRLPSGIGWRLSQTGAHISLDNSIYLGDGNRPVKTKQIIMQAEMTSDRHQISWDLQREGL